MNYTIKTPAPALTVEVEGRLDTVTAPVLEDALQKDVESSSKFVLDLGKVDYLSSAGLRLLLTWQKQAKHKDGEFVLRNVQPAVMDILRISGFVKILTIE